MTKSRQDGKRTIIVPDEIWIPVHDKYFMMKSSQIARTLYEALLTGKIIITINGEVKENDIQPTK